MTNSPSRWNFYNLGNSLKYPKEVLGPWRYEWSQRNNFIALGIQDKKSLSSDDPKWQRKTDRAHVMQRNSIIHFLSHAKRGDYCYLNGSSNRKTPLVTHRAKYQGRFYTTSKEWATEFAHLGMMFNPQLNPFEGKDHPHINGTASQPKFFVEVDTWQVIPNPGKGAGRPGQILYEVKDTTKNSQNFPVGPLDHVGPLDTGDVDGTEDPEVPGEIILWKP